MISIQAVSKKFGRTILENIYLEIKPGEICCLLGEKGAGKSTLVNIILGLTRADNGKILINDRLINQNTVFSLGEIGFVSNQDHIIDHLTGYQFLLFQCLIFKIPKSIRDELINSLAAHFFEDNTVIHKQVAAFSTGMRMKLRIIGSLLQNPRTLVLDEPFAHLDPVAAEKLSSLLKIFSEKNNSTILIASTDLLHAAKTATRICVLHDAGIAFNGSKIEFTKNERIKIGKIRSNLISTPAHAAENDTG